MKTVAPSVRMKEGIAHLLRGAIVILGVVPLFALSAGHAGTDSTRRTTLELVFHEGTDMEAVPSPDGRHLALQLWSQIWILDTTTGRARRLTDAISPPDEHWYPRWSPDGSSVVFFSLRAGGGLYVVPVSGGPPRQLTFREFDFWPSWSPDGRTIVFRRGSRGGLWVVPASGGDAHKLATEASNARQPSWSPDGRWIACIWQGRVTIMAADGSAVRQITKGPDDQAPSWSPDGRQVFFLSAKDGERQIWSVPVDGGEPTQLTREPALRAGPPLWMPSRGVLVFAADGKVCTLDPTRSTRGTIPFEAHISLSRESYARRPPVLPAPGQRLPVVGIYRPAPSPDGRGIAFSAMGDLWMRDASGSVEPLTSGPEDDVDPAWSPDGRQLAYVSSRGGEYQVWTLDLSSRMTRQVTTAPGHAETPLWSPSGDAIVFVQSPRPRARPTICVVPSAGGSVRTIVPAGSSDVRPLGWFPKDRSLVFVQLVYDATTFAPRSIVRRVGLDGSAVSWTGDPPEQVEFAALSHDGETLAFVSHGDLWIRPLASENSTARRLIQGPALFPAWSADRTLVYVSGGTLMRVDAGSGRQQTLPVSLSVEIPRSPSLLLQNARVRTPEPRDGLWDILLENGQIRSLRQAGQSRPRADRTVDLEGRFVIPGLVNLHEHLFSGNPLPGYLYWGVTSVAGAGEEGHWAVAQQEAIRSGRIEGPRLFVAGGFVVPSQMNAFPQFLRADTPAQVDGYLDHLAGLGATQVKAFDRREPWVEAATIGAAHRRGLPVLSHFLRPASVAAGLDRKEHALYYGRDGDIMERFAQDTIEILRKADITISSTLVWAFVQSPEGRERFRSALTRADVGGFLLPSWAQFLRSGLEKPSAQAADYERYLAVGMANTAAVRAAGIRLVAGTDYVFLVSGLHWELELLVRAGLSPLEALRAATSTGGAALGLDGRIGTISPGAVADLVVLDADPLENIGNTQKIHAVIQGGRIIDRPALLHSPAKAER